MSQFKFPQKIPGNGSHFLFSDANVDLTTNVGVDGSVVVGVIGPDENPGFLEVHSTKSQGDDDHRPADTDADTSKHLPCTSATLATIE